MCDLHRIRARLHQRLRQREGALAGAGIAERTGIRKHCGIETGGDLGRDRGPGGERQPINEFGGSARRGIDPVHVGKRAAAGVVIDVDEELLLQTAKMGALYAIALQHDGGLVMPVDGGGVNHAFCEWQWLVNHRNWVVQHNFGLLAQLMKDLRAGQHRADGVAIRTGV